MKIESPFWIPQFPKGGRLCRDLRYFACSVFDDAAVPYSVTLSHDLLVFEELSISAVHEWAACGLLEIDVVGMLFFSLEIC